MREIKAHHSNEVNKALRLEASPELSPGGAPIQYQVATRSHGQWQSHSRIKFHQGELNEGGPNGVTTEVLLAVVIDQLQGWNKPGNKFSCRENAIALTHLETALLWLKARTAERMERGVEGTQEK